MGWNSTAGWTLFALSVAGMIISLITPGTDEVDEWLMVGGGAVAFVGMTMIGWKPFKQKPAAGSGRCPGRGRDGCHAGGKPRLPCNTKVIRQRARHSHYVLNVRLRVAPTKEVSGMASPRQAGRALKVRMVRIDPG